MIINIKIPNTQETLQKKLKNKSEKQMERHIELIDFHAHILPAADHGSTDAAQTERQLSIISQAGIDTVVATPHFYPNNTTVHEFIQMIDHCAHELISLNTERPKIALGAEVLWCDGIEKMEGLDELCIRGTNVLLLELPLRKWPYELFHSVKMLSQEFIVVLAHIDRYIPQNSGTIKALLDCGAFAQINAYSLFSFSKRRKLADFLKSEKLVALGSDLHGEDKTAYKKFTRSKKYLGDSFDTIMLRSEALLRNAKYI